jgi:hypothetical protein
MIKSWFGHGRRWFRPAGGAGRNQDAALSPLLAVTNVPLMLARLIARTVVALGDSSRFSGEEPA